jgi:hypothetical protein
MPRFHNVFLTARPNNPMPRVHLSANIFVHLAHKFVVNQLILRIKLPKKFG